MTSAHGTRRQGRRWRLESCDKKHETWAEEACWYDGTNANGTPRLDMAIKEAHELIDKGMTVRIFDLWDCTAHYINPDRGIAPNAQGNRTCAASCASSG